MDIEVEFLEVNVCTVCLIEKSNLLAVHFDETLDSCIGTILVKHLWFQPEELQFKYVCEECWDQVHQFHDFYIAAEKAHADMKSSTVPRDLEDVVKTESYHTEAQSTYLLEVEEADCVSPKQEVSEELDQTDNIVLEVEQEDEELSDFRQNESTSESESSEDDSDSESPKTRSNKARKKQRTKKSETIEKIYHKSIEQIEEEDRNINEHCKLSCTDCETSFTKFLNFKQHFRKVHHETRPVVVCCGRKFNKRVRLVEHVTKHMNPDAFRCTVCDKSYCNSTNLNIHMLKHGSPEALVHKCDQCERSFAKKYQLNAHMLQHVPEEERKCVCPSCNKAYATASLLNAHVKSKHLPVELYICEVCAKNFKSRYQFEKHRMEHNESYQEIRLQCKICSKWMKNASSLRKHVLRHDGEGGKHECEYCGKSAPNVLALQSHISFVHKKDKLFQCTLCPKAFKRQFTLIEHMTTHTGEVLYQCPFCSKTFNSSANMHAHKKKTHPQEWEKSKRISELPFAGSTNPSVS
ncbi:transcription factor grauzone-like isoform X1 [Ochlerotatus camptorhynchus]|uniref:transcription factor grauzone-like isoform X1 n=1 Tax=Ochlerotatus camptorhynchus TaxID=644619 RepID=UPI0031DD2513